MNRRFVRSLFSITGIFRSTTAMRWSIVVCALALIGVLIPSCSGGLGSPSNQTPVILLSIDTLRSDRLPAYGYKGVATPHLDALRKDAILYERAYSHVPLTLPAHASLLTGELPGRHGVRDNVGFRLQDSTTLLQQLLKKNGYATGGAVSAFVLRHETGIARGFDFYDDSVTPLEGMPVIGRVQRAGEETVAAITKWIDGIGSKPFFAFVHIYEPHTPYTPPEPYASRYADKYDGEIAHADAIVGQLIDHLKAKDLYEKAMIIVLSDHGEGLNEHNEEEHGIFLYREAIQIPLFVKLPGSRRGGSSVASPVGLIDVFPTILERTATPLPQAGGGGESLLTLLDEPKQRLIYAESYYPKFHFGWSDLHSLIDGKDHYIRAPIPELYDLEADPGEKKNRIDEDRRTHVRLREAIEPLVKEASAPTNIDPEDAAKLAALGYVGSTVTTRPGQVLPDPKTTVGVFHQIRLAYTMFKDKKLEESLALTNKLLADNHQITDLWDLKCKVLNQMRKPREAIAAAKEGLTHVSSIALLFNVANGALALGDLDDAEKHAELAAKIEPGEAHEILSRIALKRGDVAKAEKEAKLSLEAAQDRTAALAVLGGIEKDRGNLNAALGYYDRAVQHAAKNPKHENVRQQRGDILARLGRNDEAEREFRQEIENFPKNADAYSSLIVLLVTQRRFQEATQLVYKAIEAAPEPHTYAVMAETLVAIGDERGAQYWAFQGQQKFPGDAELRTLPQRLRDAAPKLRQRLLTGAPS